MCRSLSMSRNPANMSEIVDLPARSTKVRTDNSVRLGSQMDVLDACTYALSIVNDLRTPENESEHVRKGGNSLTHLIEAQRYAQRSYRLWNNLYTPGTCTCVGMKSQHTGEVEDLGNVVDVLTTCTDAQSVEDNSKMTTSANPRFFWIHLSHLKVWNVWVCLKVSEISHSSN